MEERLPARWSAELSLLAVVLIWGMNMPMMKFALGRMDEYLFNFARLSFSSLLLGCLILFRRDKFLDHSPHARPIGYQIFYILLFSLLAGFAYQLFFMLGMRSTSAGNTALILSTMPIWASLLALVFLREHLSRIAWIGLGIALGGTTLVALGKDPGPNASSLVGNLLVALAALSWAVASVISRPMMRNIGPIPLAFSAVTITLPLHLLLARSTLFDIQEMFQDPLLFGAVAFSGLFSTGVAYALYNFSVAQLGTAHATAYQNLVPAVAIFFAWLFINEIPYESQIIGGILIISGLLIMRWKRTAMAISTAK